MRFLFCMVLLSTSAHGAQVIAVHSGDTLTVLEQGRPVKLQLANVDAPELDQPYGIAARDALEKLCKGKEAGYDMQEKSGAGAVFASVRCDGTDAERAQLKSGLAWVRPRSAIDPAFTLIQDFVWRDKIGLWAESNPVPPWEWDARKK